MEIAKEVDYAPHYLRAKSLLHDIYEHLNNKDLDRAEELSFHLIVEVKLLSNAVKAQK